MTQKQVEIKITKDMTIGDLASKYPEAADVLMSEGIQCVGCGAANYETVEEGLSGHGKDAEYITEVLVKMNEAVENAADAPQAEKIDVKNAKFTLQDSAIKKLKEIMKAENKEDHGLRIEVVPGGCSGYKYGLDFDHQKRPDDVVFTQEGVSIYMDPESVSMLDGGSVEYVESLQGAGFKINNPSATGGCGCGKSFN